MSSESLPGGFSEWRITDVRSYGSYLYVVELERADGETAYVDLQCWDDMRARECRVCRLSAESDPIDQDAARWVDAQCPEQLGGAVIDWDVRDVRVAS